MSRTEDKARHLSDILSPVLDYVPAGEGQEAWAFYEVAYKLAGMAEMKRKIKAEPSARPLYRFTYEGKGGVKALKMRSAMLTAFASLALCGCGGGPRPGAPSKEAQARPVEVAATATPSPTPRAEMSVDEFFSAGGQPTWGSKVAKLVEAWKREPGRERYRLVRPDDFTIPEGMARAARLRALEVALPFVWGEFGGNSGDNLVLLVADRTKESPDRFGVVLFKERKAGGYDVRWIYRDADFSNGLTVNRHSGDIYLLKFVGSDGPDTACDIEWGRAERKFICRDS